METVSELFRTLNTTYGFDLSIFYDSYDADLFTRGMYFTALLSAASVFGSLFLGVIGAYLQFNGGVVARKFVSAYIQVFRNTPPLIQLYFFFFSLGPSLTSATGMSEPILSNVAWAIVSLTLYAGAFNIEVFRSGVEAVPAATIEAADSLGLSKRQTFLQIILPLAFRISLPGLNNNLVNLIKTTTNAYAIAVPELLYGASQVWSDKLNALEMMIVLLIVYTAVIGLFTWMMGCIERNLAVPGWGRA